MYIENEELVLLEDFGRENTPAFIPKGTRVTFIKLIHNENDLAESMIVVKYGERVIPVKEANVKVLDNKRIEKEFKEFNKKMMERNPELKAYHPNIILRTYYRILFYVKRKFKI